MKPFDPEATCPKCGNNYVTHRYCSGHPMSNPFCPHGEHIDRRCGGCGYSWYERTLDSEEVQVENG